MTPTPTTTAPPLRAVCPYCGEWRADMLQHDGRVWCCSLCGRLARELKMVPEKTGEKP